MFSTQCLLMNYAVVVFKLRYEVWSQVSLRISDEAICLTDHDGSAIGCYSW